MNNYGLGVALAVFGSMLISVQLGIRFSQASLIFAVIAAICAPIVIHRIQSVPWSAGMLLALAYYASFPLKKLFQLEGFVQEVPVTLIYAGLLWVIGQGWKRSWS